MTTGEIMTLLRARGFRFTHSLGQNFLTDEETLASIVRAADVAGENVLEIGAGAGCLTKELAARAKRVMAVEIDSALIPVLQTVLFPLKNVRVIHGDALKLDLKSLTEEYFDGEPFVVAANLPYSITTPILFRLLEEDLPAKRMCLMLQKEAVGRVIARPGAKEYGPLAILCAYRAEASAVLTAAPHCFYPQPHVESTVILLRLRPHGAKVDQPAFLRFVKACFLMRRKTLLNNLLALGLARQDAEEALIQAGISPGARAETLSLDTFLNLYQIVAIPPVSKPENVV